MITLKTIMIAAAVSESESGRDARENARRTVSQGLRCGRGKAAHEAD